MFIFCKFANRTRFGTAKNKTTGTPKKSNLVRILLSATIFYFILKNFFFFSFLIHQIMSYLISFIDPFHYSNINTTNYNLLHLCSVFRQLANEWRYLDTIPPVETDTDKKSKHFDNSLTTVSTVSIFKNVLSRMALSVQLMSLTLFRISSTTKIWYRKSEPVVRGWLWFEGKFQFRSWQHNNLFVLATMKRKNCSWRTIDQQGEFKSNIFVSGLSANPAVCWLPECLREKVWIFVWIHFALPNSHQIMKSKRNK